MNNEIIIYTASGEIRTTLALYKGAKGVFSLGGDDYITIPFVAEEPIPFAIGDWCDLSTLEDESLAENFRRRFVIVEPQFPSYDLATDGYKYDLKMQAAYKVWGNKICKYFGQTISGEVLNSAETSWSLTASISEHLEVILRNIKAYGFKHTAWVDGEWETKDYSPDVKSSVTTEARLVSYSDTSVLDALSSLATTFECEWWVDNNIIRFGHAESEGNPVVLTLGKEVKSMERSDSAGTHATRLYVFGSNKNLPYNYRKTDNGDIVQGIVQSRLMLPEGVPYLDAYTYDDAGGKVDIGTSPYSEGLGENLFPNSQLVKRSSNEYGVYQLCSIIDTYGTGLYTISFDIKTDVAKKNVQVYSTPTSTENLKYNLKKKYTYIDTTTEWQRFKLVLEWVENPNWAGRLQNAFLSFYGTYGSGAIINLRNLKVEKGADGDGEWCPTPSEIAAEKEKTHGWVNLHNPMPTSEAVEAVVVNDEIFPTFKAYISDVFMWEEKQKDQNGNETGKYDPFYVVKLEYKDAYGNARPFEFDDKWLVDSSSDGLGFTFTSGKCNGMSFGVKFHKSEFSKIDQRTNKEMKVDGQCYEIVANEDWGRRLPDSLLSPDKPRKDAEVVDEVILTGWDATAIDNTRSPLYNRVKDAEQRLLDWGKEYIAKTMIDDGVYKCTLASHWAAQNGEIMDIPDYKLVMVGNNFVRMQTRENASTFVSNTDTTKDTVFSVFGLGQQVILENPAFFSSRRKSRIIGYEMNLDIPYDAPVYSVGESVQYSLLGALEGKVDEVTMTGQSLQNSISRIGGGSSIYLIKSGDKTKETESNAYSANRAKAQFFDKKDVLNNPTATELSQTDKVVSAQYSTLNYLNKVTQEEQSVNAPLKLNTLKVGEFSTPSALGAGAFLGMMGNDSYLEVDRMLVRKVAKFVELAIQKIQHTGGQLIMSPASLTVTDVKRLSESKTEVPEATADKDVFYWRCYFKNEQDGEQADNAFINGDLALSQVFSKEDGQARRWWRRVRYTGNDYIEVYGDAAAVKYNTTGNIMEEGSDYPKVGDVVVQLGHIENNGHDDRQSAIILDTVGVDAPSIKFYSGIDGHFSLVNKSKTWFSSQGNQVTGKLYAVADDGTTTGVASALKVATDGVALLTTKTNELGTAMNSVVTNDRFAGLESAFKDTTGKITESSVKAYVDNAAGEAIGTVEIDAEHINLNGYVSNENHSFEITPDGKLKAKDGEFEGRLKTSFPKMTSDNCQPYSVWYKKTNYDGTIVDDVVRGHLLRDVVNVDCTQNPDFKNLTYGVGNLYGVVILPCSTEWIGTRVMLLNANEDNVGKSGDMSSWVVRQDGGYLKGFNKHNSIEPFPTNQFMPTRVKWLCGIMEFVCVAANDPIKPVDWWLVSATGIEQRYGYDNMITTEIVNDGADTEGNED